MVGIAQKDEALEPEVPSPAELARARQESNELTQDFHQGLHALGVELGDPHADQALAEMTKIDAELQQSSSELSRLLGDLLQKSESAPNRHT